VQRGLLDHDPYFFASAFLEQHAFVHPSGHFFAFLAQAVHAFPSLHAVQAALSFFAEHPQLSQAKTEEPAINNAIAAILIILFIFRTPF
jgi:hypothetical protein